MNHFLIILQVILLIFGTIINYNFYQAYRTNNNLIIKYLFILILLINIQIFVGFYSNYEFVNVDHKYFKIEILNIIIRLVLFTTKAALCYVLIALILKLFDFKINNAFKWLFPTIAIVYYLLYEMKIINYLIDTDYIHICSGVGLNVTPIVFIIGFLISFLFRIASTKTAGRRKSIQIFIIILLTGYLAYFFISIIKIIPGFWKIFINLFLLVSIFLWFKKYYFITASAVTSLSRNELTAIFKERYDITCREQEVLTMLLQGKNNKEIEETLFISPNTIRNHISALYRKIGINSRGQLMNLVIKIQNEK